MSDLLTPDLFAELPERPGTLACAIEIAATLSQALARARQERGLTRADVADRMSFHLGERLSENMLNAYTAQSHDGHEISLRRAMAFDAALGADVCLSLFLDKRGGGRQVMAADDAALLEWARLHHQERELAERKRALESALKIRRGK